MMSINKGTGAGISCAAEQETALSPRPGFEYVLTSQEMREADLYTSEVIGIPSMVLMERAALAVADRICRDHPDRSAVKISVVSGTGNNGADGIAAGRILAERGYRVRFFMLSDQVKEGSQCSAQLGIIHRYGLAEEPFEAEEFLDDDPDVVIDAMFGIGLARDLEGNALQAAEMISRLDRTGKQLPVVYAVDIPSGVSSDDGSILGGAAAADVTVTFGFLKRGQLMFPGAELCGEVETAQIGITTRSLFRDGNVPAASMFCYRNSKPSDLLPKRVSHGNKGTFGKALLIAGSRNMAGAALLSGEAASLAGCGMVRIMTPECNRVIVQTVLPEALLTTYQDTVSADPAEDPDYKSLKKSFEDAAGWCDTILIGPGLSKSRESLMLVRLVLESGKKLKGLVIDADALRIIASSTELEEKLVLRAQQIPVVLTPHLAECADLMHISPAELKKDMAQYVREYAESHCLTLLCKDARSIAASAGRRLMYINISGTDALAKAGSGDVLAGLCVSLIAQGMDAFDAACAASYLHGHAARVNYPDEQARTLMAMDLAKALKM